MEFDTISRGGFRTFITVAMGTAITIAVLAVTALEETAVVRVAVQDHVVDKKLNVFLVVNILQTYPKFRSALHLTLPDIIPNS